MKRIVIMLAIVVACAGVAGCKCEPVCIRTEKEHTEKVIDRKIVETGDEAAETTSKRITREERVIEREPVEK